MKDVNGNTLNLNGTYVLENAFGQQGVDNEYCITYIHWPNTDEECTDDSSYVWAYIPGWNFLNLDVLLSLGFIGFRDTICDGETITNRSCVGTGSVTRRWYSENVTAITPDDEALTAYREFLCGAPASLSGTGGGEWNRACDDICSSACLGGGGQRESAYIVSFDWELTL